MRINSEDLKLIKQLEKETGITLKRVSPVGIGGYAFTGFSADDNGWVRGLAIWKAELFRLLELLSKFQRLEKLVLYDNQISDISSLKELKGLTHLEIGQNQISDISSLKELKNLKYLDLRYNKITHMPAEFLDLGLEIKWELDTEYKGIYLEGNPLEWPPEEIIWKGMDAIRQYFKPLEGEKPTLKQHPSDKIAKELVFICYSRKDEDFVLPLCKKLKEAGVEIWLDQWNIDPGDNWDKSIDDAIYKCTKMLSILSPNAVDSYQVQGELHTFCEEKKPVIPIVYRDCRIPRILKAIQYMNFTSSDLEDKTKIAELVKIITK